MCVFVFVRLYVTKLIFKIYFKVNEFAMDLKFKKTLSETEKKFLLKKLTSFCVFLKIKKNLS